MRPRTDLEDRQDDLDQGIPDPWQNYKRDNAWKLLGRIGAAVRGVRTGQATVLARLAALAGKDLVDEPAIAAVLAGLTLECLAAALASAGLTPEAPAAALPDDLAQQVVEALGARLSRTIQPIEAA